MPDLYLLITGVADLTDFLELCLFNLLFIPNLPNSFSDILYAARIFLYFYSLDDGPPYSDIVLLGWFIGVFNSVLFIVDAPNAVVLSS